MLLRSAHRVVVLLLGALSLSTLVVPVATAAAVPVQVGVHAGVPDDKDMPARVAAYETLVQRDVDVVNVFKGFSQNYLVPDSDGARDTEEMRLLRAGHTLMVSWRAHEGCGAGDTSTPRAQREVRAQELAAGKHDAGLRAMAEQLDRLSDYGRVLVRFHWEMDQEPGGCQYIGTPSQYVDAWRHVHTLVSRLAPGVEWVWAPRAGSFNKGVGQQFWPGSAYVDIVGGSAVPRSANGKEGAWRGAADIFDEMIAFAASKARPALVWVGVREKVYDPDLDPANREWTDDPRWKADFIDELRALAGGSWQGTLGILVWYHDGSPYFDPPYDFRVNTSTRARDAMRVLVCDPAFGGCGTSGGGGSGGGGGGGSSAVPELLSYFPGPDGDGMGRWWVTDTASGGQRLLTRFGTATGWQDHLVADVGRGTQLLSYFPGPDGDGMGRWWATDTVTGTQRLLTRFGTATGWQAHLAGDVDGDGRDELLSYYPGNGTWWRTEVRADGTPRQSVLTTYATRTGWQRHRVADVDGDGRDELVSYHAASGSWWMTSVASGGATQRRLTAYSTTTGWDEHLVADITGDGRGDLLSFHGATRRWWATDLSVGAPRPRLLTTYGEGDGLAAATWAAHLAGDVDGVPPAELLSLDAATGRWWLTPVVDGQAKGRRVLVTYGTRTGWQTHLLADVR